MYPDFVDTLYNMTKGIGGHISVHDSCAVFMKILKMYDRAGKQVPHMFVRQQPNLQYTFKLTKYCGHW